MSEHTINYNKLQYLALMRYGHQIGCGWYSILVNAEKELFALGYSISGAEKGWYSFDFSRYRYERAIL